MFYTITLNPAIDYLYQLNQPLVANGTNRTQNLVTEFSSSAFGVSHMSFGGKGINVGWCYFHHNQQICNLVMVPPQRFSLLGNWLKKHALLAEKFVWFEGLRNLRINAKIVVQKQMTEINDHNYGLHPAILDQIVTYLNLRLKPNDFLGIHGSFPIFFPENSQTDQQIIQTECATYNFQLSKKFANQIGQLSQTNQIKLIVDSTCIINQILLAYQPFLFKPNQSEITELIQAANIDCHLPDELQKQIGFLDSVYQKAIAQGWGLLQVFQIEFLLISLGQHGAVLLHDNTFYVGIIPTSFAQETIVGFQGCGDCMLASFLVAYEQEKKVAINDKSIDIPQILAYSLAGGAAKALTAAIPEQIAIQALYQKHFQKDNVIIATGSINYK